MQPHQQRVVDEKSELDDRHAKLLAFFGSPIYASLSADEQARLSQQAYFMSAYSGVLGERIAAF